MANKLIWGSDLYKGFKLDKNQLLGGAIDDILPFQMLSMEEKTIDWIKAVADYYEVCGWNNVEKRAPMIQRNFMMRHGKLNHSDYIINADPGVLASAAGMFMPESPLEQFYSLAPTFVDVLRGEFIKRDNTWTIQVIDPHSSAEAFKDKEGQFQGIILQAAMLEKQNTLAQMGLTEEVDQEQYQQQMQALQEQFTQVEAKSKNFRTTGQKWAEKVIKIHDRRYNMHELEPDAFEGGLISDSEFWHLDMMDDDFKLELVNPKWCDYHKGPNVKYVSEGDYFLWFDFMSSGDIVNKFGRRMKEEDILKLKDIYVKSANIIVPDYLKNHQGAHYDLSKNWTEATDLNPAMNDGMLGKELAQNYMSSPNFDHNIDTDIFSTKAERMTSGHPQMFRVMRLYWRSLKRIGWLTRINRDGTSVPPDWIDENYKVTIDPVYDKSIVKQETKDNLIYGEHVDWTWVPSWRHVMKISPNKKHSFWLNSQNRLDAIYIDGGEVPFQFKGRNNPFESLPPIEGCTFSYINTEPHSFIDRMRPLQILYNICMNKVPKKFLKDYGNKIAIDRRMMTTNHANNSTPGIDPVEAFDDKLMNSDILDYSMSREALEGMGQPALPQILQLSTVQEAMMYLNAADQIKWMAGENVGITRQRLGANKASETAGGIQQSITYSETQTEKYFEQHSNLMQRVRQRMVDAAQYYSTFKESSREIYMNSMDENMMLDIEGMDNLLPHYNIHLQTRANVRAALQQISSFLMNENTLPIKASAKIESLIESSIPKILSVIKTSEYEQDQIVKQQQQAEQMAEQQNQQIQMQMQAQNQEHEDMQAELDRQKDIQVAEIRAMGGLQSDINANGQIDSQENLMPYLKAQEMTDKRNAEKAALDQKSQTDNNRMILEREKGLVSLEKERIKAKAALEIAKQNKNKFDK